MYCNCLLFLLNGFCVCIYLYIYTYIILYIIIITVFVFLILGPELNGHLLNSHLALIDEAMRFSKAVSAKSCTASWKVFPGDGGSE